MMQIQFTGKNIDITDAIKQFTEEKFESLTKHFKPVDLIHVVFTVENHEQKAEATTHVYGSDVHASASSNDLYAAITEMAHKLEKQLSTIKDKLIDHHR